MFVYQRVKPSGDITPIAVVKSTDSWNCTSKYLNSGAEQVPIRFKGEEVSILFCLVAINQIPHQIKCVDIMEIYGAIMELLYRNC